MLDVSFLFWKVGLWFITHESVRPHIACMKHCFFFLYMLFPSHFSLHLWQITKCISTVHGMVAQRERKHGEFYFDPKSVFFHGNKIFTSMQIVTFFFCERNFRSIHNRTLIFKYLWQFKTITILACCYHRTFEKQDHLDWALRTVRLQNICKDHFTCSH